MLYGILLTHDKSKQIICIRSTPAESQACRLRMIEFATRDNRETLAKTYANGKMVRIEETVFSSYK